MTIEKLLCMGVGFFAGICVTVIGMVCLSDWLDERDQRKGKN